MELRKFMSQVVMRMFHLLHVRAHLCGGLAHLRAGSLQCLDLRGS